MPLAIWILINGLDDLILDLVWIYRWFVTWVLLRPGACCPTRLELERAPRKRIAIYVPLWREDEVIQRMIRHNVDATRGHPRDFFVGVYPNDDRTLAAARELEAAFPSVHVAVCPHDGPTSKADNLNSIHQRMLRLEQENNLRFEIVMTHDAEDVIHPRSLPWVNYYAQKYDMVQIPVLPLPTAKPIQAVYCDEFAEFQQKEMPIRQFLGGFLPSCGVGTGFSRRALDQLAEAHGNRIFEPKCLTEDYENGFRIHQLKLPQVFVPVKKRKDGFVSTRAHFPSGFRAAVKQRTRWMMGIALQSWELHGWNDTVGQLYWFWRDRKGLIQNIAGPAAMLLFLLDAASWARGEKQAIWTDPHRWIVWGFLSVLTLQTVHLAVRMVCTARVYGWKFASWAPLRNLLGMLINFLATICAIARFTRSKCRGEPLAWLKTDHAYPTHAALMLNRRQLGEILVGSRRLPAAEMKIALASQPPGLRIGEYLVQQGKLTEEQLYEALSSQHNLSTEKLTLRQISRAVARTLPVDISRKWKVLGFKVVAGQLFVATPEVPCAEMADDLNRFSPLDLRFHLITPSNFQDLEREFLSRA